MYRERDAETTAEHIEDLVHLYIDGAFSRRDLLKRVAKYTGGAAAAAAALEPYGLAQQPPPPIPPGISVPESDSGVQWFDVTYPGKGGPIFGYFARPRQEERKLPAVIVIHENRGLNDHIKDVTRRVAKAGFVGLAVDLVSRQGGTRAFPDPAAATQALNRVTAAERIEDVQSTIDFLKGDASVYVIGDKLGIVGFCLGGGVVFSMGFATRDLAAAVPFYGTPPNPLPNLDDWSPRLMCVFSETDYNQNSRIPELVAGMVQRRKVFGLHLYQGSAHGFHNDTSPIYNPVAAADAWGKTMAFFRAHLGGPA